MTGGLRPVRDEASVSNRSLDLAATQELRGAFNEWYRLRRRSGTVPAGEAVGMYELLSDLGCNHAA